jgi:hypothetical protein
MKKQMQKIYAIMNKETKEIEMFGTSPAPVKAEFDEYYSDDENFYL